MRYHDDDSFTGLGHAKRGKAAPGHRGTWGGTTRHRLATAEGRPQRGLQNQQLQPQRRGRPESAHLHRAGGRNRVGRTERGCD